MQKSGLRFSALLFFTFVAAGGLAARAKAADGEQKFAELGTCKLVSGQQIEHCRLGYRTWGALNADRSNAVLFPTWFSGTTANLTDAIQPGALVDPTKYFVIGVDALGDGVSSSPSNSATQHGPDFPAITIQDMVNSEYRLATETLGLKHLHAVMGISMGGIQTFEWMVDYPEFMDVAIPLVGSPRPNSRDLLLYRTSTDAVKDDPVWQKGRYTQPIAASVADLIWQMNLSTPMYYVRTHSTDGFSAEYAGMYSHGLLPFDANDWLAQLDAMVHHDVAHGGRLEDAAKRVTARVFVVNAAQDHMVNPQPGLDFARLLGAKTMVLESDCGHLAVSCEAATLDPAVRAFLDGK
ncbi:MAG TPA: alpha/beta fold hydrolase [Terracidiphilus sp.]|nr:alpha/beta fold hydrolase [Terracidiphilus sp.]